MVSIQEITDWAELDALRLPWKLLLTQTRGASFLQSWDWLNTYARHHHQFVQPRILVVRHDREVLGILPLVIRTERNRLGSFRTLTYPLDDWGNFYGPIGRDQTVTLHTGMKHIARSPRNYDLIQLKWVPRRWTDRGRTPGALQQAGFQAYAREEATSAFIELQATWEDYWASRSRRWRSNCRRSERKLKEAGELRYVHYRPVGKSSDDADPRWDLYDACEQIAQASWQGASTTGTTLSHPQIRAFMRDMHETATDAGGVDMHLLYLNDQPAAFTYNYHCQGMISGLRSGFDPNVSRDGAGSVLMRKVIETAYAHGDHTFDMGADFINCKNSWLTTVIAAYSYSHFPLAVPTSQLVRLKRIWEARRQRQAEAKSEQASRDRATA